MGGNRIRLESGGGMRGGRRERLVDNGIGGLMGVVREG